MGQTSSASAAQELSSVIQRGDDAALSRFLARWGAARNTLAVAPPATTTSTAAPSATPGCSDQISCLVPVSSLMPVSTEALRALDINSLLPRGGCTPLQLAARSGNVETVRRLLNVEANPCGLDRYGRSALHYAARHRSPQVIADLLQAKADPCVADMQGKTPLDVAREQQSTGAVRTIEDRVKLWQGWVDFYEKRLIGGAWVPKWLVVLQDRRPNSGPAARPIKMTCASCRSANEVPPFVAEFDCAGCRKRLVVTASAQIALYDPGAAAAKRMVLPDSAVPSIRESLPQMQSCLDVEQENEGLGSSVKHLLEGRLQRALQNTLGSERMHGLNLKILDKSKQVKVEYGFRVGSKLELAELMRILKDPGRAAYEASMAALLLAGAPVPQFPAAPAPAPACAPPASAPPAATVPRQAQAAASKTGHYSLEPKPVAVSQPRAPPQPPADVGSAAAAQALAGAAPSAPPVDDEDAGKCVVCWERRADTAIIPCGHMCGCNICLKDVFASAAPQCPMCRGPITSLVRIYQN